MCFQEHPTTDLSIPLGIIIIIIVLRLYTQ